MVDSAERSSIRRQHHRVGQRRTRDCCAAYITEVERGRTSRKSWSGIGDLQYDGDNRLRRARPNSGERNSGAIIPRTEAGGIHAHLQGARCLPARCREQQPGGVERRASDGGRVVLRARLAGQGDRLQSRQRRGSHLIGKRKTGRRSGDRWRGRRLRQGAGSGYGGQRQYSKSYSHYPSFGSSKSTRYWLDGLLPWFEIGALSLKQRACLGAATRSAKRKYCCRCRVSRSQAAACTPTRQPRFPWD